MHHRSNKLEYIYKTDTSLSKSKKDRQPMTKTNKQTNKQWTTKNYTEHSIPQITQNYCKTSYCSYPMWFKLIWLLFIELQCFENETKCDDGLHCYTISFMCDGFHDCQDASDEDPNKCKGMYVLSDCLGLAIFKYQNHWVGKN